MIKALENLINNADHKDIIDLDMALCACPMTFESYAPIALQLAACVANRSNQILNKPSYADAECEFYNKEEDK